jgi:dGTPase
VRVEAQRVIGNLARAYLDDPRLLPDSWHRGEGSQAVARNVADYIAGMTDPFAIKRHEALIGPVELPEKF